MDTELQDKVERHNKEAVRANYYMLLVGVIIITIGTAMAIHKPFFSSLFNAFSDNFTYARTAIILIAIGVFVSFRAMKTIISYHRFSRRA